MICSNCGSNKIITDEWTGEILCQDCGCVLGQVESPIDWRAFTYEEYEEKAHTGNPLRLRRHDMGLCTIIDPTFNKNDRFVKLRILDDRTKYRQRGHRNFAVAFNELEKLRSRLMVGEDVVEYAAYIYRKAYQKKCTRGRAIKASIAASFYIACRSMGVLRSIKEIAEVSDITEKEVAKNYRDIVNELDITMPIFEPKIFVNGIVSRLQLKEDITRIALRILDVLKDDDSVRDKTPVGVAAAAVYLACQIAKLKIRQWMVAEASQVTEITIRKRYNEMKKALARKRYYTHLS